MNVAIKKFKDLSPLELYEILQLRSEVFVVEQDCVYQDIDGNDQKALHIIGTVENKIIAYKMHCSRALLLVLPLLLLLELQV